MCKHTPQTELPMRHLSVPNLDREGLNSLCTQNTPWLMEKTMKRRAVIYLSLTLALSACGSTVANTDKPSGIYIAGATSVSGDFGVKEATRRPTTGGAIVSGVSCKNKIWDPAPSKEAAISVLKREAKDAGYNTIYIESVTSDPNALLKNCWSAIIAKGIAFNS